MTRVDSVPFPKGLAVPEAKGADAGAQAVAAVTATEPAVVEHWIAARAGGQLQVACTVRPEDSAHTVVALVVEAAAGERTLCRSVSVVSGEEACTGEGLGTVAFREQAGSVPRRVTSVAHGFVLVPGEGTRPFVFRQTLVVQ